METTIENPARTRQVYHAETSTGAVRKVINRVLSEIFTKSKKVELSVNESSGECVYTINHKGVIASLYIQELNAEKGGEA